MGIARQEVERYRGFVRDEESAITLYTALSRREKDANLSKVFAMLAKTEQGHADEWRRKLEQAGVRLKPYRPDLKTRLILFLIRRFGTGLVLPSVLSMESSGSAAYAEVDGAAEMARDEQSHGRVLRAMRHVASGGVEGSTLARAEGRHRGAGGNALRAAVLGANDGLVSNLSLIMGVAGAGLPGRSILLTGFAGLLAGSIAMALGEWLSVQSARELHTRQIEIERSEVESSPEDEAEELALIYQARGIERSKARSLAQEILSDPAGAVQTLVREELGLDPEALGGSAWEASISSFFMFAIGAIFPVIGFLFLSGPVAIAVSIGCAIIGLFLVGALTSLSTSRSLLFSGGRMVIFGVLAAIVTYGIGRLIGGGAAL